MWRENGRRVLPSYGSKLNLLYKYERIFRNLSLKMRDELFFYWTLRNQFSFTDCSEVLFNWPRSPFPHPTTQKTLSGLFSLDYLIILHLNGLIQKHPLLIGNLDSDPMKWEGAVRGIGGGRVSLPLQRLWRVSRFALKSKKGIVFLQFHRWQTA